MSDGLLAPAKINLFLHVGDKRADGFHALQSLAVFTGVGDRLTCVAADALSLHIDGPFAAGLSGEGDNLVLRAARALAAHAGSSKGAALTLTKNLPVASGIGGGSADAAAALCGLNDLWKLNFTGDVLREIAATLGSDIPVCVSSIPSWMEGRGEIVRSVGAMPALAMLLVNPGVAVPTGPVFGALQTRRGVAMELPADGFRETAHLLRFLERTANDLEAPARVLAPEVGAVLEALAGLPGCLFSRMSGSGATCFAIFPDNYSAGHSAGLLRAMRPDWWITPTKIAARGVPDEKPGLDLAPTLRGL